MHILITGHSEFPVGLSKALEMIAGAQEDVKIIPFLELEDLKTEISEYFASVGDEQVLCFTDLVGGTPYRTCVELSLEKNNIAVVGGSNLGMLLEASAMRSIIESAEDLAKMVVESGQSAINYFTLPVDESDEDTDGI